MKKQKSDKPAESQKAIVMPFLFLILLITFIVLGIQRDYLLNKTFQLKNERADAFCKNQSYEKVIEPEKNNYTDEFYTKVVDNKLLKKDERVYNLEITVGYFWRNNTRIPKEQVQTIMPDLTCDWGGIGKCYIIIPAKTETRNFETGYYNQTDNSYYCQAEPKAIICFDEKFIKTPVFPSCKDVLEGKIKPEYQKSEKFPYKNRRG